METLEKKLKNRIDFMYFYDVKDGNPNGDPDDNNEPRKDAQTQHGLVSDVCIKRKVRNYVQVRERPGESRNAIFVRSKELDGKECCLSDLVEAGYAAIGVDLEKHRNEDDAQKGGDKKGKGKIRVKDEKTIAAAREYMCNKYFDIRTFGAVMSTGVNAGQVRGPVQLTFSRSIDPIDVSRNAITVSASRNHDKSFEDQTGIQGCKFTVPYALYSCYGFVSPRLAQQTGFDTDDLALLWDALKGMFDEDRSAARGLMTPRAIIAFKHEDFMGNASADNLFRLVSVKKNDDVTAPRSFDDYTITVDSEHLPAGVTVERIL